MALAYAILIPLMPEEERGALTGFYSVSRGIGLTAGPLAAGALIALSQGFVFEGTDGFQAMWVVPFLAILASVPLTRSLIAHDRDRERLRRA